MATCAGALIVHVGGIVAGCTLDEIDADHECAGLELRHDGGSVTCWRVLDGCDVCGIHEPQS